MLSPMQDHPGGGGGVQGADGLLRGLLLHPGREADQGPTLQVQNRILCTRHISKF